MGVQSGLAALIISGAVPDHGLLSSEGRSLVEKIVIQALVVVVYLVTFVIARAAKRQAEKSVFELDQAVRGIVQRDALLQEARDDLDQALQVGGPGRFTGQQIGSYLLGVIIGRGAAGEIYEAVDTRTDELAAVKLLQRNALRDPRQLSRFMREANTVTTLSSSNVVKVLEVGDASDALPYLAMERLHGHDLARELRQRRQLPLEEVVRLVNDVANGLEAARRASIVHRDLKPQNIFRAETNGSFCWKILDFGVSMFEHGRGALTNGAVIGTPIYMAPEQAQSKPVDHRADVYGLSAVAYRSLTGNPPFHGGNLPSILYDVVHKMPRRPSELVDTPAAIDHVLIIGLSKRPDARFETAKKFADALAAAATGHFDESLHQRAKVILARHPWSLGYSDVDE